MDVWNHEKVACKDKNAEKLLYQAIWNHPIYQEYYKLLEKEEAHREFCCHQMNHFLDVARIAYIQNLEAQLGFRKELIYATALLHDIGKARQYQERIPHELASAELAEVILREASEAAGNVLCEEEQQMVLQAILKHRKEREDMTRFERLMYESDKKSRQCFACSEEKNCNWSLEKKNMEIEL